MDDPRGAEAPADIAAQLLRSSSTFARTGAAAYAAESWDVCYLHLATAVEHLVKAALARTNPLFVADQRGAFDSMLHLAGLSQRATTPISAMRTISVTEAMDRARRVIDPYQEPGTEVRLLLEARNGIVHAGANARVQADVVLAEAGRYIAALLPHVDSTEATYWGDFAELVRTHTERRLTEIEGAYQRRTQTARDRFADLTAAMDEVQLGAFVTALEPSAASVDYSAFPVQCPACESTGEVFGGPSPNWEPDWDVADGMAYAANAYVDSITLDNAAFQCRVCGLTLSGPMLELGGLGTTFSHKDSFDTSTASEFFTRQIMDDYWDS